MLQLYSGSIIIILLAKLLEIEEFGDFTFGVSLSGIISTCAEFGFSLMTQRDIPQKRYAQQPYVINVLFQKSIISIVVFLLGLIYLHLIIGSGGKGFWIKVLFLIDGVVLSYCAYFIALLQSVGRFNHETRATFVNAVLLSLMILLLVYMDVPFPVICIFFVLTHFTRLFLLLNGVGKFISFKAPALDANIQKYLLKNSWSFGLHFVLGTLYFTIDAQIIYVLLGSAQLALYDGALRIVIIVLLITNVIMQVFIPYLSAKFTTRDEHFDRSVIMLLNLLLFIGYYFALFVCVFDKQIILLVYREKYLGLAPLFVPLLLVCVLRSVAGLYGTLLTLSHNQITRVKAVLGSLLVSAAANGLLIPHYGIKGAALASLITHTFLVTVYIISTKKVYGTHYISRAAVVLLVAIITSLILMRSFPEYAVTGFMAILLGTAIYLCIIYKDVKSAWRVMFLDHGISHIRS